MSPPSSTWRAVRLVLPLLLSAVACKDNGADVTVGADFVGNWVSTSFVLDGQELMTPGSAFYVSLGFFEDGSYQIIAGGDTVGIICVPGPSCNDSGDFSYSGTVITLDPGTSDETLLQYSISGETLTISGATSLGDYSAVFERT